MNDPGLRKIAVGTSEPTEVAITGMTAARLATVIGAVVMLLRLTFSERARRDLDNATGELESAVNEVNARLARMAAQRLGGRVPLRGVSSIGSCEHHRP